MSEGQSSEGHPSSEPTPPPPADHGHSHGDHGHCDHSHGHEHHHHHEGGDHGGHGVKPYLVVFIALSIFTVVSFVVNDAVRTEMLTVIAGFALIMGVAVVKATLVGTYFMHLKQDWGKLFFIIIPVMIMGILLMVVLLPDIVLAWHD